jgi:hypothetical protein
MAYHPMKSKKPNGMPAFAGMTVGFEEKTLNKNNRHARPRLREDRLRRASHFFLLKNMGW